GPPVPVYVTDSRKARWPREGEPWHARPVDSEPAAAELAQIDAGWRGPAEDDIGRASERADAALPRSGRAHEQVRAPIAIHVARSGDREAREVVLSLPVEANARLAQQIGAARSALRLRRSGRRDRQRECRDCVGDRPGSGDATEQEHAKPKDEREVKRPSAA